MALLAAPLMLAAALLLNSCGGGGGGGTLPYVPANETRDCSSGPTGTAARIVAQSTAALPFSAIQCVQIHEYGQQIPILKTATLTVSSGSTNMLQAVVYDAACQDITSTFSSTIMWSVSTPAIGTVSSPGATATYTAAAVTSTATGTITVNIYDGTSYVKQDVIQVTVSAPTTPSAPSGLTATAGNSQVALSWTAPTTNTDSSAITDLAGYNVYSSTASGGPYTQLNTGAVTGATYTATGLTNGTAYYFVVRAYDNESPVNTSADSAEATATPAVGATPTTPNPPTGVTATAGNAQVALSWTAPTTNTDSSTITDLAGFNVYRGTASGGPYTQINSGTVTGTAYTDTGLTNGTPYYYVVRTLDNETTPNESANSTEVSGTPTAAVTTFKQTYAPVSATGYDIGSSLEQTSDGGYILAGTAPSGSGWAVKVDSLGTTQAWTYTKAGTSLHDVIQTADGGYLLGGDQGGTAALAKLDSGGTETWYQTYAGISHAYGVEEITGGYVFSGDNGADGVLAEVNSTGVQQWALTYDGGTTNEFLHSVRQASGGGYILGGYSGDGTTDDNIWLVKTDAAGAVTWNQTYLSGNSLLDHGEEVFNFGAGYIIGGYQTNNTYTVSDCIVVIVDSAGAQTASYTHGGTGTDFCYGFNVTSDGGYVMAASSTSTGSNGGEDYWLGKASSGGVEAIAQFHGDANNQFPQDVIQTSDGGYAIIGGTNISGGDWDWWLVKTDTAGLSP